MGMRQVHTSNGLGTGDESLGGLASEEDDGDELIIVLGGSSVPGDGVSLASGEDLTLGGLGHGVEAGDLGEGAGDEGHEDRGGDGELHLGNDYTRIRWGKVV